MLKNIEKYIKLKCVNLKNVETIDSNIERGVSSEEFGNVWFLLPKGNAIFKTYANRFLNNVKDERFVNELLCCELAKMVGVDCAEHEVATKNGRVGILSYNILRKDETLRTLAQVYLYNDLTLSDIYQGVKEDCEKRAITLDKDFAFDLYKMMVFDILTLQQDRHASNIHIVHNEKFNFRKLSPLIDNEFAFCTKSLGFTKAKYEDFQNFLFTSMNDGYKTRMYNYLKIKRNESYEENLSRLVDYARIDKRRYDFLKNAIKNFDVDKAFDIIENKYSVFLPNYKKYVKNVSNIIKNELVKRINMVEKNTSKENELTY